MRGDGHRALQLDGADPASEAARAHPHRGVERHSLLPELEPEPDAEYRRRPRRKPVRLSHLRVRLHAGDLRVLASRRQRGRRQEAHGGAGGSEEAHGRDDAHRRALPSLQAQPEGRAAHARVRDEPGARLRGRVGVHDAAREDPRPRQRRPRGSHAHRRRPRAHRQSRAAPPGGDQRRRKAQGRTLQPAGRPDHDGLRRQRPALLRDVRLQQVHARQVPDVPARPASRPKARARHVRPLHEPRRSRVRHVRCPGVRRHCGADRRSRERAAPSPEVRARPQAAQARPPDAVRADAREVPLPRAVGTAGPRLRAGRAPSHARSEKLIRAVVPSSHRHRSPIAWPTTA